MSGKEQVQKRVFQLTEASLKSRKARKQRDGYRFPDNLTEAKDECTTQGQQTGISAVYEGKIGRGFKIGGLYFEIRGLPAHMHLPAFEQFRCDREEAPCIRCEIIVCEQLPDLIGATPCGRLPGCMVYRKGGREYRLFGAGLCRTAGTVVHACTCLEIDSRPAGVAAHAGACREAGGRRLTEAAEARLWITPQVTQVNLASMMGFERLILPYDRLILHASCVAYQGKGILFSAPSGTGKTTQARLWQQYAGAQILNEDRALLYIPKEPASVMAYGSPYTGSSRMVSSAEAPVSAIILLEQGNETVLRPVGRREAFLRLYRELTVNTWNRVFVEQAGNLLERLTMQVPVYCLRCRADEEAVRIVEAFLSGRKFHRSEPGAGNWVIDMVSAE